MQKHAALFVALAVVPFAASGCGGSTNQANQQESNDGGPEEGGAVHDGGQTKDGGTKEAGPPACAPMNGTLSPGYPAMHSPMPQVTYQGGGVLQNPEVVTITFPGDALAQQLEAFGDDVMQTCWWDTVRAGYCESGGMNCVGRGGTAKKSHVELTTAAAASYTDSSMGGASTLQQFIQQQVSSGTFPAPDANTIYTLYFPASTSITLDGIQSCQNGGFGGYHDSTTVTPPGGSNTVVTYAVIPRCSTAIADTTFAASHELTEASTDPHVGQNNIGYYTPLMNTDDLAWRLLLGGGEVGDLCVDFTGSNLDHTTATLGSNSWTVQRIWSNANAASGLDPCVPVPAGDVYFNLAPAAGNGLLQMTVGQTKTFTATAFSSGPLNPWMIGAIDYAQLMNQTAIVQTSLSASSAKNGDAITVTVTLASQPPNLPGTNFPAEPYFLVSETGKNGPLHIWPLLVTTQ
ncbi:MAG TPA: hypothetical protein VF765_15620 [Polyangiaceae bacterium]